jgi:hypothetical protein
LRTTCWRARFGDGGEVPDRLMKIFNDDMALCIADLQESIKIDPRIPLSRYELLDAIIDMGDTQHVEQTHNSYVLDDITARVWIEMGNPGNADSKFREAQKQQELLNLLGKTAT